MIPTGWLVGFGIMGGLILWMATGILGEWNDHIDYDSCPWLWDYARWPRIRWMQSGFVAMFVLLAWAILHP